MPWKGETMEELREAFVQRALNKEKSKSALCREYGISRPTGDKWIGRHMQGKPMSNQSRAPFRTPQRTSAEVEESIVSLRRKHPAIGAKKLKRMLENKGQASPAYSTINAILHRNGLITKEASLAATPMTRFEKAAPNDMWQADFKGHFALGNGTRCHPLTIIDDHSRYCLCLDAKENERYEGVKGSLLAVFEQYGLPDSFLCDNGNPWGTVQSVGYTRFEIWLMELGILTKHGRIRHPQTQGKDERFNGTLRKELLRYRELRDFSHAQTEFDQFRGFYNQERPHHALCMDVPVQRYCKSCRPLPQKIEDWTYARDVLTRRVKDSGYLTFRGQGYFLSEALGGKHVGVQEDANGVFRVLYRQFCVAMLHVDERAVIARRPSRISHDNA
jgi:transposase InsO family protein